MPAYGSMRTLSYRSGRDIFAEKVNETLKANHPIRKCQIFREYIFSYLEAAKSEEHKYLQKVIPIERVIA